MNTGDKGNPPDTLASDLVDLSGISLDALAEMPDSVLASALRRVHREATEGAGSFFNDYAESNPGQP
ncbi:FxSxx-COOH cyclophane-containing RiPP peptide [Sphaerisporangium sp. B11E5]|uniref:FxSxx-COOH cyclophane-containing RiPP peptide n=1 Tax=Sphaerisporangium sp. B11E5 TaxID=3153563 RepID=UPI00325F1EF8